MPSSESIANGKILRHSIAALSGNPASVYDLEHYELCRKTRLSHSFLLEQMALNDGNIKRFCNAIGIANTLIVYNADNRYWITYCHLLKEFIPLYESAIRCILNELDTLPPEKLERLLNLIGIPLETLTTLANDAEEIDLAIRALRPSVVRMAELNVMRSVIANGNVKDSKWILEHGDTPYNNKEKPDDPNTTIEVIEIEAKPAQ